MADLQTNKKYMYMPSVKLIAILCRSTWQTIKPIQVEHTFSLLYSAILFPRSLDMKDFIINLPSRLLIPIRLHIIISLWDIGSTIIYTSTTHVLVLGSHVCDSA